MRVQVTLNDDFTAKVDEYAAKFGMSRSALCAMLIGLGVASFETAFTSLDKNIQKNLQLPAAEE